ncbi:MAG: ABC transporter substrate-binding protein [Anaerolineae bacterium]|nr:ABC transporter substrate-binding protein [Anaerolineae bacterium]
MPDRRKAEAVSENSYAYDLMDFPVSAPPRTVISLVPSLTESLFDLNLGDRVAAVTDYCVHPQVKVTHLPKIGGTKNPDIEQIIQLKPDLVLANQEENRREDVEALQAAGIPVWVTFPKTVKEVFNILWNLMYMFDETSMVPRIRLIEYTYDWVNGISRANEEHLPKVFVPIWLDPLMTFNQDTYIHDLLWVCGGVNVFADRERHYPLQADLGGREAYPADDDRIAGRDTRYPRVTMDEVVAAQPDIILLPSEPFEFTEHHLPIFAALDVPAARNQRIHRVDGSLLTWHGTRIAYAFDTLPALLLPPD